MKCKKIVYSLLLVCIALCMNIPSAMAKSDDLQIGWWPEIYTMDSSQDNLLAKDASTRKKIIDAISARLKELAANGKLPFVVKQGVSGNLNNIQESFSDEVPLALLPIVMLDESFDTHISVAGVEAWRHVIASGINLAVCSAGTADDEGIKMLAVVPLSGYTVIGDPSENKGKVMPAPLNDAQKSRVYAMLTADMIKNMNFNSISKALRNWQKDKVSPITTQVSDVKISSKKAQQVFHGQGVQLRNLIANTYSAEYQKTSGRLVMPPRTATSFYKNAQKGLYAFDMHSPSGKVRVSMGQPETEIVLDVSGLAEAEVSGKKASDIRKDILYKAWLKKSSNDGQAEIVLDDYMVEAQYKKDSANIGVEEKDIFARLEMKLAKKMAAQKR